VDPFALSLRIGRADGTFGRLAGDEVDPRNVLQGGSFGTVSSGGFASLSGTLDRDVSADQVATLDRFDTLQLRGVGGRIAWEGYDIAVPASKGDGATVGITGTGYSQALADDEALVVVFVTRDLSLFTGPPLIRRINLTAGGNQIDQDYDWSVESQALTLDSTAKDAPAGSLTEAWAMAPGAAKWGAVAFQSDMAAFNANDLASLWTTDTLAAFDGPYGITSNDGIVHVYSLTARKYLMFELIANLAIAGPRAAQAKWTLSKLAFYGNHGLSTLAITGEAPGIRASDAIGWGIDNQSSGVTFAKQITQSSFAIPELGFPNGCSVQDIIEQANAYEGYDYAVWEGPTVYYQPVGTNATTWHVRTTDGAKLTDQGEQAEDTWTRIVGFYQEPTGEYRTVGPPSLSSRVDYTDSRLEITDPTNPAVAHGRQRTKNLPIPFPTSANGAKQICANWLADMATVEVQGSVSITGWAVDQNGIAMPVYLVRSQDYIVIDDVSSKKRRIVDTNYDIETRTLTATLDSPPHRIEEYLAQLEARTPSA
jgi:hypothetical protein